MYAGLEQALTEDAITEHGLPVPRRARIHNSRPLYNGIEYHFHSRAGLLTIAPIQQLPTAVELHIKGETWARYPSAKLAADAVAAGLTRHHELDALPSHERPTNLEQWEKSHPHEFSA